MEEPRFRPVASIVVPVMNGSKVIGRCVESLLAQTPPFSFEIIVVDDGSKDGTPDQVPRNPLVTVLRRPHGGPASARNGGASRASGRVLVFTDADCVARPGWLAALAGPVVSGEADAAKGRYATLQTGLAPRFAQVEFEERYAMLSAVQKRGETIDFIDTYSMAVRRDLFMEAGGFDTAYPGANNEDVDFSYRLAAMGSRMNFVDDAVVEHTHPATVASYGRTKFWRGFWRMRVYRDHPGRMVRDSYTPQVLKIQALAGAFVGASIPLACFRAIFPYSRSSKRRYLWNLSLAAATSTALIAATSLPLARVCDRFDPDLTRVVPAMTVLRAVALGLGAAFGVLRWKIAPSVCRFVSALLPGQDPANGPAGMPAGQR